MNRKAVSPVVATILLIAVAVASVSSYYVWVRSFQTQIQKEVEQKAGASSMTKMEVVSINHDGTNYYVTLKNLSSSGNITFHGTQDFILDGNNNWGSITPTPNGSSIPRGSTKTFVLKHNSIRPASGNSHSFVFIGHTLKDQVVATIYYTDL